MASKIYTSHVLFDSIVMYIMFIIDLEYDNMPQDKIQWITLTIKIFNTDNVSRDLIYYMLVVIQMVRRRAPYSSGSVLGF